MEMDLFGTATFPNWIFQSYYSSIGTPITKSSETSPSHLFSLNYHYLFLFIQLHNIKYSFRMGKSNDLASRYSSLTGAPKNMARYSSAMQNMIPIRPGKWVAPLKLNRKWSYFDNLQI